MADISTITLSGTTYNIKDSAARTNISELNKDVQDLSNSVSAALSDIEQSDSVISYGDLGAAKYSKLKNTTYSTVSDRLNADTDQLSGELVDVGKDLKLLESYTKYPLSYNDYQNLLHNHKYLSKTDGSMVNNEGYRCTDKIPVKSGEVIRYRLYGTFNMLNIAFYSTNGVFDSDHSVIGPASNPTIDRFVAPTDGYVAICTAYTDQSTIDRSYFAFGELDVSKEAFAKFDGKSQYEIYLNDVVFYDFDFYLTSTGEFASGTYRASEFIPVFEGDVIRLSCTHNSNAARSIVFYDGDFNCLETYSKPWWRNVEVQSAPADGYVRICLESPAVGKNYTRFSISRPAGKTHEKPIVEDLVLNKALTFESNMPDFPLYPSLASNDCIRFNMIPIMHEGYLSKISCKMSHSSSTPTIAHFYICSFGVDEVMHVDGIIDITVDFNSVDLPVVEFVNGVDFVYTNKVKKLSVIGVEFDDAETKVCFWRDTNVPDPNGYSWMSEGYTYDTTPVVGSTIGYAPTNNYQISVGMEIAIDEPEVKTKAIYYEGSNNHRVDAYTISCKVTPSDLTGKVLLYRNANSSVPASMIAFADFVNGKIGFYQPAGHITDTLTEYSPSVVNFTPVAGKEYLMIMQRESPQVQTLKLIDAATMTEVVSNGNNVNYSGSGWGAPGYQATGGVSVTCLECIDVQPLNPKVMVVGDSYIEGSTMADQEANRYAARIRDYLDGDVFINGYGGASYRILLSAAQGLVDRVKPEYIIVNLGVNNANRYRYIHTFHWFAEFCKSRGIIPVFVTTAPCTNMSITEIAFQNEWIKASGYRYIDVCKALTTNGDNTHLNTALFFGDQIHPNADGHLAIFNRAKIDIPEIFNIR